MRTKLLAIRWLTPRSAIALLFEPRDLWVGVYWETRHGLEVYVCIVPCFPIKYYNSRA
jgi:hypothetical protein